MAEYRIDIEKSAQNILDKIYERFGVSAERLVELAKADREGRCVVLPCKGWLEIVFGEQEVFYGIDHDYAENPVREISVDSSDRCTWYNGWKTVVLKGYDENGLDWEFSPEDIGKTVFLSREDAEKALEEMEGNGNGRVYRERSPAQSDDYIG